MKIIQIMDTLTSTGGVNTFVFDLCIALKKARQDVTLIGLMGDKNKEEELAQVVKNAGIPVYCLWMTSKKDAILHGVPKLRERIQVTAGTEQTVCNLHLKLSVLIGGLATRGMRNVRCVETYHSRYSKYWLERKLMSPRISKYICCSESATEEFKNRFHTKDEKVVCIPNGIDGEELKKSIEGAEKRESDVITFLSVGRFTDQKNLHVTTAALSSLNSSKAVYKIIGEGPLKELAIQAANNSQSVQFLGTVPRRDVVYELSNADMVIMPSLWEGLSIFMLEAMAMGCPLMISDVESLRSVVHEKPLKTNEAWRRCDWGYLVSTSDTEAYREAACDYINHIDLKPAMSRNALLVAEEYSITATARKYIEVYDEVVI